MVNRYFISLLIFISMIVLFLYNYKLNNTEYLSFANDLAIPSIVYTESHLPKNFYLTEYDVEFFNDVLSKSEIQENYIFTGIPLLINNNRFIYTIGKYISNYLLGILNDALLLEIPVRKFKILQYDVKEVIYFYKNIKTPYNTWSKTILTSTLAEFEIQDFSSDVYKVISEYIVYRQDKIWGVLIELCTLHKINDNIKQLSQNIQLLSHNIKGLVYQDKLTHLITNNLLGKQNIEYGRDTIIIDDKENEESYLCNREKLYQKQFHIKYDSGKDCNIH